MVVKLSVVNFSYSIHIFMWSPCILMHYTLIVLKLPLLYSQYQIHHTRLRESQSGFLECNVRAKLQEVADITDLATDNLKIIFSPGFILGDVPRLGWNIPN